MVEYIVESLEVFLSDVEDCASLVLEHPHSSDTVNDILSQEFPEDAPHVRYGHELLLKLNFNGEAVFLACEETSRGKSVLVVS